MNSHRSWKNYRPDYRAREMKQLARWVLSGESGCVVGLPGSGRSNLVGFLCHRPDVLRSYLPEQARPVGLIPVDLNNLPATNLVTLYRVILRAFYRVSDQFEAPLQEKVASLYREHQAGRDAFLAQSALQELLLAFQGQSTQVVLVLNRFDHFCRLATPSIVNTLRGLRDEFKDTLCYLVGMPQEVAYLPDPAMLGNMYEILDNYVCWVGAMSQADSRQMIVEETGLAAEGPAEAEVTALLALCGGYPILLKTACHWWLTVEQKPALAEWPVVLLAERGIQHRLAKIWTGLTQEEQFIVSELQRKQRQPDGLTTQLGSEGEPQAQVLERLAAKGICRRTGSGWQIGGGLLAAYVAQVGGQGGGRVWLEEMTGQIYRGQTLLPELTTLERSVLTFLIKQPYTRHNKTDLIINTWPDELRREGVSDNSLYQVIFALRQALETSPSQPVYLVNWRGKPEGGYQFFPEGRPSSG